MAQPSPGSPAPALTTSSQSSPETLTMPSTPSTLLDLHTSLLLSLWPALTLSISLYVAPAPSLQNPSPSSSGGEVRDWLAGTLSSMLQSRELRDREDVEDVLEQVLSDEFQVVIDDGSVAEVAARVWWGAERLRAGTQTGRDDVEAEIRRLWDVWIRTGGKQAVVGKKVDVADDAQETDGEEEDDDDDRDRDEEMEDIVPDLVDVSRTTREKPVPEVDGEGFTKVVRGKRR